MSDDMPGNWRAMNAMATARLVARSQNRASCALLIFTARCARNPVITAAVLSRPRMFMAWPMV